jgi:hypothetical protein
MARDSQKVYQALYKHGPLAKARMTEALSEEEFQIAWIGAQTSHGKNRIATIPTADETYYGLTSKSLKQLKKWEGRPTK